MGQLIGLFDHFSQIDTIPVERIAVWLEHPGNVKLLENRLANRILYPQVIATTTEEELFDLAILREGLKLYQRDYCNTNLKKITIPEIFTNFITDLSKLTLAFIDAYKPTGIYSLIMQCQQVGSKDLGTIIHPEILARNGWLDISVDDQKYKVKIGSVMIIPADQIKVEIKFTSNFAKLDGKTDLVTEVNGGKVGIVIDAR